MIPWKTGDQCANKVLKARIRVCPIRMKVIMAMAAIELLIAAEAALGAMNVAPLRSLRVVSPVTPRVLGTFMDGGFATWAPEDAKAEKGYLFLGLLQTEGWPQVKGCLKCWRLAGHWYLILIGSTPECRTSLSSWEMQLQGSECQEPTSMLGKACLMGWNCQVERARAWVYSVQNNMPVILRDAMSF